MYAVINQQGKDQQIAWKWAKDRQAVHRIRKTKAYKYAEDVLKD